MSDKPQPLIKLVEKFTAMSEDWHNHERYNAALSGCAFHVGLTAQAILAEVESLAKEWREHRAHTYASENADHYRGFDAGLQRCAEAIEQRVLPLLKGTPRCNSATLERT